MEVPQVDPIPAEESALPAAFLAATDVEFALVAADPEPSASSGPSPKIGGADARPQAPPGLAEASLGLPSEPREPGDNDPRMLTVRLTSTGDAQRDARRLRRVHGLLQSYPGRDRFVFHVFEASRQYHLEFPNSTTGVCQDLFAQLAALLGEGMYSVERLRLQ
jgi:DNA polymerase-3 subunit alpha